jgi:hypothetical protein
MKNLDDKCPDMVGCFNSKEPHGCKSVIIRKELNKGYPLQ